MFKGKKIIAVCMPRPYEATRFRYIELLNSVAVSRDFKLFVYQTNSDLFMNNTSDIGEEYVFDLIDYDVVDGIIIFTEMIKNQKVTRKIADNAISRGIPVISVEAPMESCINVKHDYGDCFEEIVRHIIIDHKLTKVNFIAGFEGNSFSEERHDVYKKVLAEQGIPYEKERVGYGNFWEYPTRQVMEKFLADGKELPEAIICCNDVMAMVACKCLAEKGYSVPNDVIVSGFDGIEDEKYHTPRLTTCRSSEENLARKAVDIIDRAINGEKVPDEIHISFEMVVSQSCGCVKSQTEDGSKMINDLHSRLTGYMQRSYNMTSLSTIISNEKNIENIYEHLLNKQELIDTYCCLNTDALQPRSGIMERDSECPFTDEMLMIFKGSYEKPIAEVVCFNRKDIAPNLENFIGWQVPLVFTSIHYLDTCLGYLCMAMPVEMIHYERIPQVSEAFGNGFGNVRMFAAMERLYTHDTLTELYNRRGFYQLVLPKFEEATHGGLTVAIISADLDGLKIINDTYGHSEGDCAIKVVGEALKNASHQGEICARFGGDEFVVAGVIDSDENYVEEYKKNFYDYIDEFNKKSGKPYKVAASIGLICKSAEGSTVDDLIKLSDDLMYRDKASRKKVRSRPREEN